MNHLKCMYNSLICLIKELPALSAIIFTTVATLSTIVAPISIGIFTGIFARCFLLDKLGLPESTKKFDGKYRVVVLMSLVSISAYVLFCLGLSGISEETLNTLSFLDKIKEVLNHNDAKTFVFSFFSIPLLAIFMSQILEMIFNICLFFANVLYKLYKKAKDELKNIKNTTKKCISCNG